MFGYNKPQLMAIVFCHKERGISVEEEKHLVTVGIVKKSKTILVLLASPILLSIYLLVRWVAVKIKYPNSLREGSDYESNRRTPFGIELHTLEFDSLPRPLRHMRRKQGVPSASTPHFSAARRSFFLFRVRLAKKESPLGEEQPKCSHPCLIFWHRGSPLRSRGLRAPFQKYAISERAFPNCTPMFTRTPCRSLRSRGWGRSRW